MRSSTTRFGLLKTAKDYYVEDLDTRDKFLNAMGDKNGRLVFGKAPEDRMLEIAEQRVKDLESGLAEHEAKIRDVGKGIDEAAAALEKIRESGPKWGRRLGIGAAAVAVPGLAYLGYRHLKKRK